VSPFPCIPFLACLKALPRFPVSLHPRFPYPIIAMNDYEQKTLDHFFTAGMLRIIPAKQKKRDVILRFLASKFEAGRMYPEKEVNEILLAYHYDCASLRRWLVDRGLLQRQIVRVVDAKALVEGEPEIAYEISYWRP
jgi:hypothetical protein